MGDQFTIDARNVETVLLAMQDPSSPRTYFAVARFETHHETKWEQFCFAVKQGWRKHRKLSEVKHIQSGEVWTYGDRPIRVELDENSRIDSKRSCHLIDGLKGRRPQVMGTPCEGHYTLLLVIGRNAWIRDTQQAALLEIMRQKAGRN